jgi:hypothetical protein
MEDPELGFSPKNCIQRPFGVFLKRCKLPIENYLDRANFSREKIYSLSKKYKNINILDPKNLYCDNSYCYAVREGKMLYADDDHHSIDGSIMQAEYFREKVFNVK